jgi:glucose dehydrogenase
MGIGGSDLGVRGRVLAFDAATGRELWRFHTIPMGEEAGAETWQRPGTAKTGGGGVWGVMSLDVSTGELFVPVGNPWPDIDKDYRPGDNLVTNSIVVLDARTGALRWWHQVSPADWMDLDLVAAPMLYRADGARDFMAVAGKDGYVTVVDSPRCGTAITLFHSSAPVAASSAISRPSQVPRNIRPSSSATPRFEPPQLSSSGRYWNFQRSAQVVASSATVSRGVAV